MVGFFVWLKEEFTIYWLYICFYHSMSDTSSSPPEEGEKKQHTSLLSDILKASQKKASVGVSSNVNPQEHNDANLSEQSPVPQKPREPISMGIFLKLIGSLLFISIIFFGSFLAYIAFNPDQAIFFTKTIGIDPNDVQNLLRKLINGSFWFVMMITSIVWIVSLFRAFWVPKDLKRKKLLSWLTAAVVWILLFSILAFWAFLFNKVGATDYSNPDGTILIYDHNLYVSEKFNSASRIYDTANIIWPVDVFFDIRRNAELLIKNNLYTIEWFTMNFDEAECSNGSDIIRWENPATEQSTICRFSKVKAYNISWSYTVRSRDGSVENIPMVLPNIEIRWLISIKNQENSRWQKIITLDATNLKKLWTPKWIFESTGKEVIESSITEIVTPVPQWLCLKIFDGTGCDRLFLLEAKDNKSVEWSIEAIQDENDKKTFRFSLSWVTLNQNGIVNIEWLLDNQSIICRGNSETCNHTFTSYGRKNLKATIEMANWEKYSFETDVVSNEPLTIVKSIKVLNDAWNIVNDEGTYDITLKAYVLKNAIIPPESLTFDARDIVSGNWWFSLKEVLWRISNGRTVEERRGEKISVEFNQPLRYTIEAIYTFKKSVPGENDTEETLKETIIVDIERRSLMPRMKITTTSDYVPALVTIDASLSESEEGEIKKFIFDFWEKRTPTEWDAIQQYTYKSSGEKVITLTIVSENGEKTSLKKTLVLKDQVKTIDFIPSISPWIIGNTIDFEANGTTGQIDDYIWNFGDNSPVSRGYNTAHVYEKPGIYTIELTIVYNDGTEQHKKKTYEVVEKI